MWTPISLTELEEWISRGESRLERELLKFWELIKIQPQKWQESEYGDVGGGFWVIAVFGNRVIYFNDIEEGFNVSPYTTYGQINDYSCEQSELDWVILSITKGSKQIKL